MLIYDLYYALFIIHEKYLHLRATIINLTRIDKAPQYLSTIKTQLKRFVGNDPPTYLLHKVFIYIILP